MTSGKHIQKRKRMLVAALILFVLVAAISFWLWIPFYLKSGLSDFTHKKSAGKYALKIESINRSFFPFALAIEGINLEPVTDAFSDSSFINEKILYHFNAGEIKFEGIDLLKLIRNRTLAGELIIISRPKIKLAGEELLQYDSLSISSGFIHNLWPLFGYIDRVEIKKIEFEDADFGFYGGTGDTDFISRAEKVAIDVHGFTIGKELSGTSENFVETEDIFLRMNDFNFDMGDGLHMLTIDTLLYSLKTTDIKVNGFRLLPYSLNEEENIFEVYVPEVYVKSKSITHFALKDSLHVSFLEFIKPSIKFFQKKQPRIIDFEVLENFDLYSLVSNKFIKLEVDSFFLQGATVEIFRQPNIDNFRQQFKSIDVVLHGFDLDSTSYLNKEKIFHADNLEMQVSDYYLKLEDNEHHFLAGSLFASTLKNELKAEDIQIFPVSQNKENLRNEINIACEALIIKHVNFLELYHRRILPTSAIEVTEPDVSLKYNMEKEKKQKKENSGLLFDLVTDYLQGAYADSVRITKGKLNIRNSYREELKGYLETSIDFNLSDFRLDSLSVQESNNFFFASDFDLMFTDYNMRLTDDFHKLEVDTLSISSHDDQVSILNLRLQPVIENITPEIMKSSGHSELFRIDVPKINLKSVNLKDAFFDYKVHIEDFTINQPKIYFENFRQFKDPDDKQEISEFYELLFSYIEDIDVRRFQVKDGLLTWINHAKENRTTKFDNEFSASFHNFRLNEAELSKRRLLFSDDFDLTIKDQEFALSDDVHILKGSEIRFSSSESSINVKEALLFPRISSKKYSELPTTWQIAIPEIKIEGFDFHRAYFSQKPDVHYIELIKPRFQAYIQPDKTKGLDMKTYSIPMPDFIESLKITELKINGGEAITYKKEGLKHIAMANFYFNLSVPDLMFEKNEENQIAVSSSNIKLNISDFKVPVDDIHNLLIGSVDFNRNDMSIEVQDLNLIPFISDASRNSFTISAPAIIFTEFNYDAAFNENNFIFEGINATNPDITISINEKSENESSEFLETLDLYPYVDHLINSISVKNLDILNAHLNLTQFHKLIIDNKLNLSFNEILLGENQSPQHLLNSQTFSISTSGLTTKSKNGMYGFSVDSLIYTSAGNKAILKNLQVKPLINIRNFPLKNGFQTDVAEAAVDYIEFIGLNERRWLQDNILEAKALVIGPANIKLFRDKRFPFNENQRPEWPQDLLREVKQPFVFDSIMLMPSKIRYSELLPIFDEPGYIEFTQIILNGSRLTNIVEENRDNNLFLLNAEALLQNKARLEARFQFDLNSPDYYHTIKGSLEPIPLMSLNSMIMKSAPVAVESGQLNHLEFEITCNEDSAKGQLMLDYQDLKVAVLDYSGEEIQKSRFSSLLANTLKVNAQHSVGNLPKPTEVEFKRDEKRSVIHLWWKSIYSGIGKVIGL